MSQFSDEMKVIPRAAKVIAIVSALIVPCVLLAFVILVSVNPEHRSMSWVPFVALVGLGAMLILSTYILLIGYIAGDAKRRGMRPILWILLAIFMPSAIGIILYFILREPLLKKCPKCGAGSNHGFTFCSVCGEALGKACPSCKSAVQPGWSHCAQCGASLPPA